MKLDFSNEKVQKSCKSQLMDDIIFPSQKYVSRFKISISKIKNAQLRNPFKLESSSLRLCDNIKTSKLNSISKDIAKQNYPAQPHKITNSHDNKTLLQNNTKRNLS